MSDVVYMNPEDHPGFIKPGSIPPLPRVESALGFTVGDRVRISAEGLYVVRPSTQKQIEEQYHGFPLTGIVDMGGGVYEAETTAEIGCYMIPLACLEKVG